MLKQKVFDLKKKVNNQKEIQEIKENKIKEEEIFKDVLVNKKVSKLENKIKTTTKNKVKNSQKKRKAIY